MILPSYATEIWSYFTTFLAWDVVQIIIGMIGIAIGAMAVRLVWGIIKH